VSGTVRISAYWRKGGKEFVPGKSYGGGAQAPPPGSPMSGTFTAIDSKTNKIVWQDKTPYPLGGGATVTAGDLVFRGEPDGNFLALDAKTGEELWRFQTGFGADAPPVVYQVDGEQYVAIATGGNVTQGSAYGDAVWAFSLKGQVGPLWPPPPPATIAGPLWISSRWPAVDIASIPIATGITTVKVGEAAFSIDPLSSQGVQTALGSGLHAAAVIHTILQRPDDTALALEFYSLRQLASVEIHRAAAASFYREAMRSKSGAFWQDRIPDRRLTESEVPTLDQPNLTEQTVIRLASGVHFQTSPTVQGNFIVRATALTSPTLVRPIAFLDGILIAPLVAMIQSPMEAALVIETWSRCISADQAKAIMRWLWKAGVLVQ